MRPGLRRAAIASFVALQGCQPAAPGPLPVPPAPANAPAPAPAPARPGFSLEGDLVQGGLVRGLAPSGAESLTLDGKPVPLAPDGRFILGLDRDQGSAAWLTARLADGGMAEQPLRIAPRSWRIEHIGIAQRPGGASADYLRLRERELARIAAARAVNSASESWAASEGWRQRFVWPAVGRISGVFGSQRVYRGTPGA